jgi:APA family basic amino acid/polyamine antiporter
MKERRQLVKVLGVGFGVAVTVGGTIGTGILRKPGPIAEMLGEPWVIMAVWVFVSVYALAGTLCTVELGTSLPRAGAWYVYSQRAFGDYPGFVVGINSWLGTSAAMGFGAYTLSEYMALLFPGLLGEEAFVSVFLLSVLVAIHVLGLKVVSRFQNWMSLVKGVGLSAFIVICFWFGEPVTLSDTVQATQSILEKGNWLAALLFSLQAVFYTFDGWHTAAYFTEEDQNPVKNLPRSMIGGVLLVITIYLLVNLSLLYVLPMDTLASSKLAAADAVALIFGEKSGKMVTAFLMVSILGIVNAQLMLNPRVIYSMSRDGLFFSWVCRVSKRGGLTIATPLTAVVSVLLIASGREMCERLSDVATFFFVMGYASAFASLLALRRKEPSLIRPWKVPLYPFLPIAMLGLSLGFLLMAVVQDLSGSVYALLFLVFSYPMYRLLKKSNRAK